MESTREGHEEPTTTTRAVIATRLHRRSGAWERFLPIQPYCTDTRQSDRKQHADLYLRTTKAYISTRWCDTSDYRSATENFGTYEMVTTSNYRSDIKIFYLFRPILGQQE